MKNQKNINEAWRSKLIIILRNATKSGGAGTIANNLAFTLVELVVAVGIIGILAAMAVPAYNAMVGKAKVGKAVAEINGLERDINAYYIDRNVYPDVMSVSVIGRPIPMDPWGRPYQYAKLAKDDGTVDPGLLSGAGTSLNEDFDLYSFGPDGVETPFDVATYNETNNFDVTRVNNGAEVRKRDY